MARSYGDYAPWPVPDTSDIPIERSTILAMGLSYAPDTFKPYVYRGTGEDTLTPMLGLAPRRRRKAKRKARRKPEVKRERKPPMRYSTVSFRMLTPEEFAAEREAYLAEQEVDRTEARQEEQVAPKRRPSKPMASPGWKPSTADDFADLLAELDD